ncbi:hypothetical protein [Streptomyces viridosporus]|uniref:Secreted protein n=1 Tax=Streptomyces viridosporus T7A TaxID=665577 RepID=A0ABX6AII2_STRVD|nr:hypothetical protein [Streptomyces viridosporus]QEU87674.1 hypothetical protein CP969_25555 [Streptomyces viridosporus T7A]
MDTTRMEALLGALAVLGLLVLMVLPAVIGIVHDRRIDRQLRQAEAGRTTAPGGRDVPAAPARTTRDATPSRAPRDITSSRTPRDATSHRTTRAA